LKLIFQNNFIRKLKGENKNKSNMEMDDLDDLISKLKSKPTQK